MSGPDLVVDRLAEAARRAPHRPLFPERPGAAWQLLTNARAWAQSGAVASWLIAQGFGPGGATLGIAAGDSPERAVLLLGALRAGALVVDAGADLTFADDPFAQDTGRLVAANGIALAALARCSIDAAVAERRLHIDAGTPARRHGGACLRHDDFTTIAQAVRDWPPVDGAA